MYMIYDNVLHLPYIGCIISYSLIFHEDMGYTRLKLQDKRNCGSVE